MEPAAVHVPLAPSDDRSCIERGHDAVTQLVAYVEQRLAHYRAAGELAVVFGVPVVRRKLGEQIDHALRRTATPPTDPAAPPAGAPAAAWTAPDTTSPPEHASAPGNGAGPPSPEPSAVRTDRAVHVDARELPIPGYDTLSASQVVERLTGLPASDLDEVHAYESAHRNRRTVLGKIDQLRSDA